MTKLTDLEICRRIADIDGTDAIIDDEKLKLNCKLHKGENAINVATIYNPLTDDALCFKLMVKYGIQLNYTACPAGSGSLYFANTPSRESSDYDYIPNKAICLAIIEAHKN